MKNEEKQKDRNEKIQKQKLLIPSFFKRLNQNIIINQEKITNDQNKAQDKTQDKTQDNTDFHEILSFKTIFGWLLYFIYLLLVNL